jgi:predicted kinase
MNTVIVSTDEIRKKLTGTYSFSYNTNERIFATAKRIINESLLNGFDVVFDATNIKKESRKAFIKIAQDTSSDAIAFVLNTPLSVCLTRNSLRIPEKCVPNDVIISMADSNLNIETNEGFSEVHYINYSIKNF